MMPKEKMLTPCPKMHSDMICSAETPHDYCSTTRCMKIINNLVKRYIEAPEEDEAFGDIKGIVVAGKHPTEKYAQNLEIECEVVFKKILKQLSSTEYGKPDRRVG